MSWLIIYETIDILLLCLPALSFSDHLCLWLPYIHSFPEPN